MAANTNRALDRVRQLCGALNTEAIALAVDQQHAIESARDILAPLTDLDVGIATAFELLCDAATLATPLNSRSARAPATPAEPA